MYKVDFVLNIFWEKNPVKQHYKIFFSFVVIRFLWGGELRIIYTAINQKTNYLYVQISVCIIEIFI